MINHPPSPTHSMECGAMKNKQEELPSHATTHHGALPRNVENNTTTTLTQCTSKTPKQRRKQYTPRQIIRNTPLQQVTTSHSFETSNTFTLSSQQEQTPTQDNKKISFNPCSHCDNVYSSNNLLKEHMVIHNNPNSFSAIKHNIEEHTEINKNKNQEINTPNKVKKNTKETLKIYIKNKAKTHKQKKSNPHTQSHSKDTPFKCKTCQKTFSSANLLYHHTFISHYKKRGYVCHICSSSSSSSSSSQKIFKFKKEFNTHMKIHNLK
ncbi:MAG: hypothetical protein KAG53_04535 [Endozoicomonadaceae bacterium]|nr:hypothetical protein [Endozoicomonadaceae bacterium]